MKEAITIVTVALSALFLSGSLDAQAHELDLLRPATIMTSDSDVSQGTAITLLCEEREGLTFSIDGLASIQGEDLLNLAFDHAFAGVGASVGNGRYQAGIGVVQDVVGPDGSRTVAYFTVSLQ